MILWKMIVGMLVFVGACATLPDSAQSRSSLHKKETRPEIVRYGNGSLERLPDDLREVCGDYFARQGSIIIFMFKEHEDHTQALFQWEKEYLTVTVDDSYLVPYARLDPRTRKIEVRLSRKDFNRASCLERHNDLRAAGEHPPLLLFLGPVDIRKKGRNIEE